MKPRQFQAYQLHAAGKGPAEIGRDMSISRQSAADLVKRAERTLQLFANENSPAKPTQGAELASAAVAPFEGPVPLTVYSERLAVDYTSYAPWSMVSLNNLYDGIKQGQDPWKYFAFCEELLERNSNVRALVGIRSAQSASLPVVPDADLTMLRDRKRTADFIAMMKKAGLAEVRKDTTKAFLPGLAVVGLEWETDGTTWTIKKLHSCDLKSFLFDRKNPRKLYIRPAKINDPLIEAPAGQFVVVFAGGKPGNPARSGLAMPLGISYVLKTTAKRDWAFFLNNYGIPASAVHLPADMPPPQPEAMLAWEKLARDLGPRSAVVVPSGATAAYLQHSAVGGSADAFERLVRYEDENEAKLVLGGALTTGTSNTGTGGSQALGQVHNQLRYDLQHDDVTGEEAWMNEAAQYWHAWNFTDGTAPRVICEIVEPEDITALVEAATAAKELGVPVSKRKLAKRLGLELADPSEPKDSITYQEPLSVAPPGGTVSANSAQGTEHEPAPTDTQTNAQGQRYAQAAADPLMELADASTQDWSATVADIDAVMVEVAQASTGLDDMRQRLADFVETGDIQTLRLYITQQRVKARLAGLAGATL